MKSLSAYAVLNKFNYLFEPDFISKCIYLYVSYSVCLSVYI